MAEIYRRVGGRKLTKIIALHAEVQRELTRLAAEKAGIAAGLLDSRSKHRTGTSTISVDEGDVDRYVVLDDTRGLKAALSIEYGRKAEEREHDDGEPYTIGGTEGLFVLHDAFGLPHGGNRA